MARFFMNWVFLTNHGASGDAACHELGHAVCPTNKGAALGRVDWAEDLEQVHLLHGSYAAHTDAGAEDAHLGLVADLQLLEDVVELVVEDEGRLEGHELDLVFLHKPVGPVDNPAPLDG